ncbi:MAG: T9SS type A sorting domain-containing protein [Gemmatimonadetes bacterium]|nr:T9SS type A sorting domain-containing protein [Gemmatimonadota bacterium]
MRLLAVLLVFLSLLAPPVLSQDDRIFDYVTPEALKIPHLEIDTEQGWGAAFGDYNNDGYPDLVFLEIPTTLHLFQNEGGTRFTSRHFNVQTNASAHQKYAGTVWGDYDNDGDLDLHVPIFATRGGEYYTLDSHPMLLQRNDRGVFHSVTEEAGLDNTHPTYHSIWLDYNRDGDLDLYTTPAQEPWGPYPPGIDRSDLRNRLYRSNGDGTFTEVTAEAGLGFEFLPYGGGQGGTIAADFDNDGWPDLFVAAPNAANRLFINDGQGGFTDHTGGGLSDPGEPGGATAGDINNDGLLDLFVTSQGSGTGESLVFRPQLLLNLGGGEFLDITEGAGLDAVTAVISLAPRFGDLDNDGDLDLLFTAISLAGEGVLYLLFLNEGDGTFTDASHRLDTDEAFVGLALGDYNLDGFLDLFYPADKGRLDRELGTVNSERGVGWGTDCCRIRRGNVSALFRNRGNDNHYLRVDLVGTNSNRDGIGARLVATAGDLVQTRQILGGDGYDQDEMIAHFGLGSRPRVDRLEVHWLSGHVDVIEDVAADQKVRLIEGRGELFAVEPTTWQHGLPDATSIGQTLSLDIRVHPALFDSGARIESVIADLSAFGDGESVALTAAEDGTYRLQTSLAVDGASGLREIAVHIQQQTALGSHWVGLSKTIAVNAGANGRELFSDGPAPGWRLEGRGTAQVNPQSTTRVHTGASAQAITLPARSDSAVYLFDDPRGPFIGPFLYPQQHPGIFLDPYTHLSFQLNTDDAQIDSLLVDINHRTILLPFWTQPARVSLTGSRPQQTRDWLLAANENPDETVDLINTRGTEDLSYRYMNLDLSRKGWHEVHVPLDSLDGIDYKLPLTLVRFNGRVTGTFYIDDLRLTTNPPGTAPTAVLDEQTSMTPETFALDPNYPNPFNSGTVIRFALPASGDVELAVYNMVGQRVATLVQGSREAGSYAINWDGLDRAGRSLATGVYLYKLTAGERTITRKLTLLR